MMTKKPQWRQIYLLGALMAILLLVAHFAFSEAATRHLAQIGIVMICYGLILTWLKSQARAVEREEWVRRGEIADPDLAITRQQEFYHLMLSPREAGMQKKGKG